MAKVQNQKVSLGKILLFALSLALTLVSVTKETLAQSQSSSQFETPPSMRGAVDFWIQIFTQYGKNHLVFHHRLDPAIIYSILDFRELADTTAPGKFIKLKEEEVDRETERIQAELLALAHSGEAKSVWAKRVERLFDRFGAKDKRRFYREAAQVENIRTQTGIRELFAAALVRSGQYLPAIEAIFTERGLPSELGRMPFVESSFNYDAYSSVGAAGIWQFMRGTAKNYMRVGSAIDERRDPIIATRAAARYLEHAYKVLGAWPLAITSYNHGITGIARASRAVGSTDISRIIKEYDGKTWGFASKNFYAEFLAALEVESNYKRYFPGLILDSPVYFDEVQLGSGTEFGRIVSVSGLSDDEFEHLNPALRRSSFGKKSIIPASAFVKLPYGKAASLLAISRGSVLTWQFGPRGGRRFSAGEPLKRIEAEKKSGIRQVKKSKVSPKKGASVKPAVVKKVTGKKQKFTKKRK